MYQGQTSKNLPQYLSREQQLLLLFQAEMNKNKDGLLRDTSNLVVEPFLSRNCKNSLSNEINKYGNTKNLKKQYAPDLFF